MRLGQSIALSFAEPGGFVSAAGPDAARVLSVAAITNTVEFTPAERDLIRRAFMSRWSEPLRLADGILSEAMGDRPEQGRTETHRRRAEHAGARVGDDRRNGSGFPPRPLHGVWIRRAASHGGQLKASSAGTLRSSHRRTRAPVGGSLMFGRSANILIGDRFTKIDQPSRVFIVMVLEDRPGRLPHAFVSGAPNGGNRLLAAVSAHRDPALFRRL
ncbi:hypothetical protein [Azospirillum thermophilum]|uniref:hypothetical protein n=1 Tax=Azospirillum thermophilum TaxID=2202148 RepID=UPI0011B82C76|nr:hypothetical protein [Azospirillum thermophilum]